MTTPEMDAAIRAAKPHVWLKAVDGMLVDMLTGDVLGPSCLDGFGYSYPIPTNPPSRKREPRNLP